MLVLLVWRERLLRDDRDARSREKQQRDGARPSVLRFLTSRHQLGPRSVSSSHEAAVQFLPRQLPGRCRTVGAMNGELSLFELGVRELGGEVGDDLEGDDPDTVARFGRFVFCKDDQGSSFGLHEPPR